MTNKEYQKIAQKICTDIDDYISDDVSITNISELFIQKLHKALLKYKDKTSSYSMAKECNSIYSIEIEEYTKMIDDSNLIYYSDPISKEDEIFCLESFQIVFFRFIQYMLKNYPNVDKILSEIGFENPEELINIAQDIKSIHDVQTLEVLNAFNKKFDWDDSKVTFFIFLAFFYFLRSFIMEALSRLPIDFIIEMLKIIKNIGDKHKLEYYERKNKYICIFHNLSEYVLKHGNGFIRLLKKYTAGFIRENELTIKTVCQHFDSIAISPTIKCMILDISFFLYHFLYQKPEHIVSLILSSFTDKIPLDFQQELICSFKEKDYAPIFQYEYECYLKKNNEHSDFTIGFYFGEPVNLKTFGIEDYDFWNTNAQEISSTQQHNGILSPKANNLEVRAVNEDCIESSCKSILANEHRLSDHLPYPPAFGQIFSGAERTKVIKTLYKKLNEEYMQCSSMEYFSYVFGKVGTGRSYKPKEDDYINWIAGKRSLQCLILKLYRPDGAKQIVRNTWTKVENCFLLDDTLILPKTMKLATNHITDSCEEGINILISDLIKEHTS